METAGCRCTTVQYHATQMQNHDNGTPFYDSLIIVKSVLVYITEPNAVVIHRSLPDSVKGLVARHQSYEIGTRCNLEMSHVDLAMWTPSTVPNPGLNEGSHSCPARTLLRDSVATCIRALTAASPPWNASLTGNSICTLSRTHVLLPLYAITASP